MNWLLLAAAGGAGSLLRFGLDSVVSQRIKGVFPYGTLAVNASGSFALGVLQGRGVMPFVVGTGLIGAYTTFSTWMFESERLGEEGETSLGVANIVVSAAVGLAAAGAGWALGAAL